MAFICFHSAVHIVAFSRALWGVIRHLGGAAPPAESPYLAPGQQNRGHQAERRVWGGSQVTSATLAVIVSLGMLGTIFASGRCRFLSMFPDRAVGMPAKGGFACTALPPRCSPCVGKGEADLTQTAVMRSCFRACFASVALPSSHRAFRRSLFRFS